MRILAFEYQILIRYLSGSDLLCMLLANVHCHVANIWESYHLLMLDNRPLSYVDARL